ncbi:MAG: putative lipoprotein [Flavobacteriales bacterium]|jgi:predicted lipoprotein
MFQKLLFTLLIMHSLVGCIKEPTSEMISDEDNFDRKSMLTNLADNYIIPGYATYNVAIDELESNWISFKDNPDLTHLDNLKSAFNNALRTWQSISFLEFGPASSVALRAQSNIYPINVTLINDNISNGITNVGSVANYTAKGFQAVDFLIFSEPTSANEVSYLSQTDVINYMDALILDLKVNANYVANQWTSYRISFIDNNISNAVGSAVSEMSNTIIKHYETYIRKGKVGLPLGVFNGFSQLPLPTHIEARYSQANLQYAIESVEYLRLFLNGESYDGTKDGLGLLDYSNYVNATVNGSPLSEEIYNQMGSIITYSENVVGSWETEVTDNTASHMNMYQEYQKLVPLLKVDLTSAIGVTIDYQDNDGD